MSQQDWRPGERREIDRELRMLWGGQLDQKKREELLSALALTRTPYEAVRRAMKAIARRPPTVEQILAEIEAHSPKAMA